MNSLSNYEEIMKSLLLAASLLVAPSVFARDNDAAEYAYQLSQAKISLIDALTTAQTEAKGTAVSAELDSSQGKVVYEVEVLANEKIFDVKINAVDGTILSVKEDRD